MHVLSFIVVHNSHLVHNFFGSYSHLFDSCMKISIAMSRCGVIVILYLPISNWENLYSVRI